MILPGGEGERRAAMRPVCPVCRADLAALAGAALGCRRCDRSYAAQDGIPDLRLFPDPFLSLEEDERRARRVVEALDGRSFESLLEHYWSLSDTTPVALRSRFVRSARLAEARARAYLQRPDTRRLASGRRPRRVLEVGSGTGALLAAALGDGSGHEIVGTDIAMRWLHVSRGRFAELGLAPPPLYCCCAEHLPFPDQAFDLVFAIATLEFVRDPERVLGECARVLAPDGVLFLTTVNRYSVAPSPHTGLFGIGFLPRRLQAARVRWWRGAVDSPIRPRSLGELDRMAAAHFPRRRFELADIPDEALAALSAAERRAVALYRRLRRWRLLRPLMLRFGPEWEVTLSRS